MRYVGISNETPIGLHCLSKVAEKQKNIPLYIQNSYNWDGIKRKLNKLKEVDQSTVTIEGTAFDGDFKDLTQDLPAAVVGKYLFWEASFDGSHTLSNWKNKTSWNVIGPENAYLAMGVDTTYTVGALSLIHI